jgi:hypothetical protein
MFKIALLIWMIVGTSLAGVAMIAILTVPQFADQAMKLIPLLCGGAFVLAIPVSYVVAGFMVQRTRVQLH